MDVYQKFYYYSPSKNHSNLRQDEKRYFIHNENIIAIFDITYDNDLNAILGIVRTIFVCSVLTVGALFFSKDANDLVLVPIENMLSKVIKIKYFTKNFDL